MIVILFRSRLTAAAGSDYTEMDARMEELARAAEGFVDVKAYTAADGERLTVVRWRDLESLRRWREDPQHRVAQETGRQLWYEYYTAEVAEVVRESHFARPVAAQVPAAP